MSGVTDETPELDDVASRALASIVLERTADTIADNGANAETALRQLHDDTGLAWDVCAAVLMACAWLAGAGGIEPAAVFAAATQLDPANDEPATEVDDAAGA